MLFVPGSRLTRIRSLSLAALVLIISVFTVFGMTVAPQPPSVTAMAGSSLVTFVVLCALSCWLGKLSERTS
jgi:hypothetical protein